MKFTITVDGELKSARAFSALDESVRDFRELWPELHMYFLRATSEQFESIGVRGGQRWQRLSERYAKWKQKKFPGKPILVRTERLKRSLSLGGSAPDQVAEFQPLYAVFGTLVPYAQYHQRGTSRMAQRQILQPTQRDIDRIVSRMYRYTERGARDAGLNVKSRGVR